TSDLPHPPTYLPRDAEINRTGATALTALPRPAALTPEQVAQQIEARAVLLDVRTAAEFGAAHVPGALNVGLGGQFAIWAGSLIAPTAPIIIVADDEAQVDESVMRLARVGLENVRGYLRGSVAAW